MLINMLHPCNRMFAHDVFAVALNVAGGQQVIFLYGNQQKLNMQMFCVVYRCLNLSNRETSRSFYRVVNKGGKTINLLKNAGKSSL